MDLFDSISRRKSCRSYIDQPMSAEQLDEIRAAIDTFEPLYPELSLDYRFVAKTKGMFHVQAPQYLIISGQGKEREQENVGFLYQQLVLWFDAHDIGCVWLGSTRDVVKNENGKDIITIAFGQVDGSVHRDRSEFKRKPVSDITNDPNDACIQAVNLAPSGMNIQPWYLQKEDGRLLFYRQLLKPPKALAYKLTKIDMGIALCHYATACRHFDKPFTFHQQGDAAAKKGYELFGYVDI
ncbi:hypothetical protein LJC55_03060 [Eubacteriales bacterium OttesenSCG-928-N14]|nr:hypothetical protein [Eubacteriales bacterium OttesenSCG-928-N14]